MRKKLFFTTLTYVIISVFFTTFGHDLPFPEDAVSYTHLTLPTNREV